MTRSSRGFIAMVAVWRVLTVFAAWAVGGCAHQSSVSFLTPSQTQASALVRTPEVARAMSAASPEAECVSPMDAWWLAEEFAAGRGDCETLIGSGGSMLPLYRDRTVLVVQRLEMEQLRAGMTVVFIGDSGRMVAHTLIARTNQGWLAQGLANRERDRTLVRQRNYIGTVIRAFTPDSRVASVRIPVLPVVSSGPIADLPGPRSSPEMLLALAPASGI